MFKHPFILAGILTLIASLAMASENRIDLAPLEVSASRTAPLGENLAVGVQVITAAQIRRMPAKNLADVLASVGGVNVSRTYGVQGAKSSIDLLGFGATASQNTLIALNGRRLNDVDMSGVDLGSIPLSVIERIEVMPASGAVLYGNGAVGGVINIVTRQHHEAWHEVELQGGSYDSRGGRLSSGLASRGWSGFVSGEYQESDGYRDNNAHEQRTLFTDHRVHNDQHAFGMTLLVDRQELRLPGGRTVDPAAPLDELHQNPKGAATPNDWANQRGLSLLPSYERKLDGNATLLLNFGLRRKSQQYFSDPSYGESDSTTLSFNPQWLSFHAFDSGVQRYGVGAELTATDYYRYTSTDPAFIGHPIHSLSINQDSLALYGYYSAALDSGTTWTAGYRHETVSTRAVDQLDSTAPGFDPFMSQGVPFEQNKTLYNANLGVRQELSSQVSLFANIERANRVAVVDEYFDVWAASPLSPLQPQRSTFYSFGTEWRHQGRRSSITAWHGDLKDEIHYDSGLFANVNLDPTRRQGVSLNSEWELDKQWQLAVSGAWQEAEFREGSYRGNQVPWVPVYTAYWRLSWQPLSFLSTSLSQRFTGQRRFDNDQNNTADKMPAYDTVDFSISAEHRGAYLTVGVFNLQDRLIYDQGIISSMIPGRYSAYPLPGRHVLVNAGYRW